MRRGRKHKCPPHHWIINSVNVGYCKYCPEVRDFGEQLRREGFFLSKPKSKSSGKRGKRGRPPKEKL